MIEEFIRLYYPQIMVVVAAIILKMYLLPRYTNAKLEKELHREIDIRFNLEMRYAALVLKFLRREEATKE